MQYQSAHWRRGVLSLYRSVLVTNRRMLNSEQRALGDRVCKQEWHAHKGKDVTEAQAREFLRSWVEYVEVLHRGKLPPLDTTLFSNQQLQQLAELRKKIVDGGSRKPDEKFWSKD